MLKPLNDNIKVQLDSDKHNFRGQGNANTSSGVVVAVPEVMNYFGMHSFVFENSLLAEDKMLKLLEYYKTLIGKRVFWSSGKQLGSVLDEGNDGVFAYLKMTDLISVGNEDDSVTNINDTSDGSLKI